MTQQPTGFALSPQQLAVGPDARVGGTVRAVGPVQVPLVEAALAALVARHEVLRTSFETLPGTDQTVAVVSESASNRLFRLEARPDGVDLVWDAPARVLDEPSLACLATELADMCAGTVSEEEPLQYVDYAGWVLDQGTVHPAPGRSRRTARTTRRPLPESGLTPQDWWRVTGAGETERAVRVDARAGDELRGAVGAYAHWSGPAGATVGWASLHPALPIVREGVRWELVDWWSTDGPPLVLRVAADEAWIELDERWCSVERAEVLLSAALTRAVDRAAGPDEGPASGPGDVHTSVVTWLCRPAHGLTLGDGVRRWTPREVRTRVGQVASAVIARTNGRREAAVALSARPGLEAVVGLLGIWCAGAVAVPVEAGGPARRVAAQLALVEPQAVVTDDPARRWPAPAVSLTPDSAVWGLEPASPTPPMAGQLACTMFTSGSTGDPKGVDVTHDALAAYADSLVARLAIGPGSSWALVTPLTADLGFTSLLAALWTSGTLVVAPTVETDLAGADWAKITPRHLALLLDTAPDPLARLPRVGVVVGGEQWSLGLRDRLLGLRPGLRVVNHYGPTETTIGVLAGEVGRDDPGEHPSLGGALAHAHVAIDTSGDQTDRTGELLIGGAGLARGYRGRPRLTADRFRPDPGAAGGRCYRTGDLVTRTADGSLLHIGRRDAQLSVNGFRVEPGEVVRALETHPAVAAAAVTTIDAGASLHAVLVADPGLPIPSLGDLRAWLADRLPAALTPAALTWVPALPTTGTGKLDRAGVTALASGPRNTQRAAPKAPATATEAALVGVWADVLGVRDLGVDDDFFALGGDSIRSLQVVSRARTLGLAFTPQDVFTHPTVSALATVVAPLGDDRQSGDEPPGPVPLLPAAAELLGRGAPDPQHYNQAFWLETPESVDEPALRGALAAIVARHDVLRTAFRPGLRGWRSDLVDGSASVPLTVVDLREDADPQTAAEALAQDAQRTLMLGRPPLMACWLVRLPEGDRLLWVAHHLVVDAVSWQVLFEQMQRAYLQLRAGVPVDLGHRTVSHRVWADALAARSDGAGRARIAGEPADPRGVDEALTVAGTDQLRTALPPETGADLLERTSAALGVPVVAVVVGLVLAAAARADGGSADVEVELHGRDLVPGLDASRTVGWLTSRVVLRPEPPDSPAGPEATLLWLRRTADELNAATPSYGPAPSIGVTYLGRSQRRFPAGSPFETFTELRVGVRAPSTPVRCRIEVAAEVVDGRLTFDWTFPATPTDRARVRTMAETLPGLVAALVRDGATAERSLRLGDYPQAGLTADDLDALLVQWQAEGFE